MRTAGFAQPHNIDELVDCSGGAGATENNLIVVAGINRVSNDAARLLTVGSALGTRERGLGVRVGVKRQDFFANGVLDEGQCTSRRGIVGVDQRLQPEACRNALSLANQRLSNPLY